MPRNSGSYYYNYKNSFSVVLLALVDADYKFLFVDVGCNGRISDGGVYRNSALSSALINNTLNIPPPQPLPGINIESPFTIVADDAFALKTYMMKPYPRTALKSKESRIFNYGLSRARRVIENAFGTLASRLRVFRAPIPLMPEKVELVVLASCVLHNFLRSKAQSENTPAVLLDQEDTHQGGVIPGQWRQDVQGGSGMVALAQQGGNRSTETAGGVHDALCMYLNTIGSVEWQDRMM